MVVHSGFRFTSPRTYPALAGWEETERGTVVQAWVEELATQTDETRDIDAREDDAPGTDGMIV